MKVRTDQKTQSLSKERLLAINVHQEDPDSFGNEIEPDGTWYRFEDLVTGILNQE
jgi:hypothetical protein